MTNPEWIEYWFVCVEEFGITRILHCDDESEAHRLEREMLKKFEHASVAVRFMRVKAGVKFSVSGRSLTGAEVGKVLIEREFCKD